MKKDKKDKWMILLFILLIIVLLFCLTSSEARF